MPEDDAALVKRSREGDMSAFEALIARHKARVCRTLYLLLANPDDVEDAAQEVFIRVFRHLSTFRGESEFSTWLHRIALNTLRNWMRTHRQTISLEALTGDRYPDMGHETVEKQVLSIEESMEVRRALAALPEHYRETIVLRHFHDLSYEEIAQIQGVPLGTVRSRIAKGRQILLDKLSAAGIFQASERTLVP
jgi:RNA polymerase sigma-70 factor (ECF subfamily)